jgi:hypothetical protein
MQNGQNLPRHFDVILGHVGRFETDQKALTPAPAGTAAPTGPATALASPGTSQTELIRVFYAVLYPDFTHTGGILANCRDVRRSDAGSKCQNCPPIIFGTCNYADFRGNFSSRGNFITGQCIGTLLIQRRSSHHHSIDGYTVKQRLRTSVSIRGHAAGVTDRGEDVRAPFGYRSEGER